MASPNNITRLDDYHKSERCFYYAEMIGLVIVSLYWFGSVQPRGYGEHTLILIAWLDKFFAMSLDEMITLLTASDNIHYTVIGATLVVCFGAIINLSRKL